MGAPFATFQDVAALRELDTWDSALVPVLLVYGAAMIRSRKPDIDTRIANGTLDPDLAKFVAVSMILRVLRNLDGIRQQTIGPYSATYDPVEASGRLQLTQDDLNWLAPPAAGAGAGTVRLGAGLGYGRDGLRRDRDSYEGRRRVWRR